MSYETRVVVLGVGGMKIILISFSLTIFCCAVCGEVSQVQPIRVTPCTLVRQAGALDGKTVQVRAHVTRGPQDDYIEAPDCDPAKTALVYFSYG